MQLLEGIQGLRSLPPGCVLTIGNFDGVHVGHRAILARMREFDRAAPAAVVTFEPHPLTVLRPEQAPPRLTSLERKRELIESLGVEHYVTLPPNADVLNLTAEEFWAILRDDVRPSHIVEGLTFNFGKGRGGTIERLQAWAASTSIKVHRLDSETAVLSDRTVVPVSSSVIRWLLGYGRVEDAAICFGRAYELSGAVIKGFERGRQLGFPTANLDCGDQLVPADGVYAGCCVVDGQPYAAAVSIGTTPTFGDRRYQVEVHLLDFSGDLYGQTLDVTLPRWVRDQRKFPSVDHLRAQLSRDLAAIRGLIPVESGADV